MAPAPRRPAPVCTSMAITTRQGGWARSSSLWTPTHTMGSWHRGRQAERAEDTQDAGVSSLFIDSGSGKGRRRRGTSTRRGLRGAVFTGPWGVPGPAAHPQLQNKLPRARRAGGRWQGLYRGGLNTVEGGGCKHGRGALPTPSGLHDGLRRPTGSSGSGPPTAGLTARPGHRSCKRDVSSSRQRRPSRPRSWGRPWWACLGPRPPLPPDR